MNRKHERQNMIAPGHEVSAEQQMLEHVVVPRQKLVRLCENLLYVQAQFPSRRLRQSLAFVRGLLGGADD